MGYDHCLLGGTSPGLAERSTLCATRVRCSLSFCLIAHYLFIHLPVKLPFILSDYCLSTSATSSFYPILADPLLFISK